MKNYRPIIIVAGEPNSIFFEIFFKVMKNNKFKSPIILIGSKNLLQKNIKFFKSKINVNEIEYSKEDLLKTNLTKINLINIEYDQKKIFEKISTKSNRYIRDSFKIAIEILNNGITNKFINGPISKKYFLKRKYLGITEYLAKKVGSKDVAMIIYNKLLSVSPLTTHLPIKHIVKKINTTNILGKVRLINSFWEQRFKVKPRIAITGLNPHCESIDKYNEDEKIIKPAIKILQKNKFNILGPYPADTLFLKNNRKNFDIIIGMYHDQVLTPSKTLFEYDAINITLGLPFIRVSPDHGPNEKMLGMNKSNSVSLLRSIQFLDF